MRRFLLTTALLSCTTAAHAAELRVDGATGNDAATYADVAAGTAAWATVGRAAWGSTDRNAPNAAEAAQKGDTVIVAAGIYETSQTSGERYDPALNPVNGSDSSSEADRIVFRADGLVELRAPHQPGGPLIGSNQRHYVTWDGFFIDEQHNTSRPDTGPVVVWASEHGAIENCTIVGDPDPLPNYNGQIDNHNGVRIEGSRYAVIRGNRISGFTHAGNGQPTRNAAGIMTYNSPFMLIENNEITNNCTGVYIKGSADPVQEGLTFRYNLVWGNTQRGIELLMIEGERSRVYQNLIYDNPVGIQLVGFQGGPSNVDVVNNTLANNNTGIGWADQIANESQGNRYHNNIVTGGTTAFAHEGADTSHLDSQHQCLFGQPNIMSIAYEGKTLAQWQAETGQDQIAPETVVVDPMYVGADDFRLQPGSTCRQLGVDMLDLDGDGATDDIIAAGAFVSGDEVIGPTGGGGPVGGNGGSGGSDGGTDGVGGSHSAGGGGAATTGGGQPADDATVGDDPAGCSCEVGAPSGAGSAWMLGMLVALGLRRRNPYRD